MEFTITVEWKRKDGSTANLEVARIESRACQSAADVGLRLDVVKPLLSTLQQVVVVELTCAPISCHCLK